MTHMHTHTYTLEKRRQARKNGRTSIKMFFLFLIVSNIIIIQTLSIIAYNW